MCAWLGRAVFLEDLRTLDVVLSALRRLLPFSCPFPATDPSAKQLCAQQYLKRSPNTECAGATAGCARSLIPQAAASLRVLARVEPAARRSGCPDAGSEALVVAVRNAGTPLCLLVPKGRGRVDVRSAYGGNHAREYANRD